MSTRRTRNNPSPSGLKSLPYGPQKRAEKKTKQVSKSADTITVNTSDKKPAPTRKRARALSKTDKDPPAKKRSVRSRQAKTSEVVNHHDEDHDADDDDDVDMAVAPSDYNPLHSSSTFHAAGKRLEERQPTEEFSSEEHGPEGHKLDISPPQHSSEGYDSREHISHESPSEDHSLEQSSRGYDSQEEQTSRDTAPATQPTSPQATIPPSPYVHKPHLLTPKPRPKTKTSPTIHSQSVDSKLSSLASKSGLKKKAVPFDIDSVDSKAATPESLAKTAQLREDFYQIVFGERSPTSNTGSPDAMKQGFGRTPSKPLENREEEQDEDSDRSISFLDAPKLTSAQRANWREQQKAFRGQLESPKAPTQRVEVSFVAMWLEKQCADTYTDYE
jgi:hypothetical protein